jgi:hypothetical protein
MLIKRSKDNNVFLSRCTFRVRLTHLEARSACAEKCQASIEGTRSLTGTCLPGLSHIHQSIHFPGCRACNRGIKATKKRKAATEGRSERPALLCVARPFSTASYHVMPRFSIVPVAQNNESTHPVPISHPSQPSNTAFFGPQRLLSQFLVWSMVYAVADLLSSSPVRDGAPRPWATSDVASMLPMGTTCDSWRSGVSGWLGMKKSVHGVPVVYVPVDSTAAAAHMATEGRPRSRRTVSRSSFMTLFFVCFQISPIHVSCT